MITFMVILVGFVFVFAMLGAFVALAFGDTKTFKAIDERIAERMVKHENIYRTNK